MSENGHVMMRAERLKKVLGKKEVLRNVNLNIREGKTTVVFGRSGEGKSVLLKHFVRLMRPDVGRVYIEDQDITDLKGLELAEVRKKVGMLFQSAALFDSLTIDENVGFALYEHTKLTRQEIRSRVREELARVHLDANVMDKKPAELSGGMKKRVGLARAICNDPDIILYDEPTTGLDPIMADAINDLIIELSDSSGLKLTVANYYTPKGHSISQVGIIPDIEVNQKKCNLIQFANHIKSNDYQLIQAVFHLKSYYILQSQKR